MSIEVAVFMGIATLLTVFQVASAEKPEEGGTVYNLLDRASWMVAGVATIAIGIWRPWFTESLWKAIIFPPIFVIGLASVFMLTVGTVLMPSAESPMQSKIQLGLLALLLIGIFFSLKSCGV